MGFMDKVNKAVERTANKLEENQKRVESRVRSELRRRSDDEIRHLIRNGTHDRGRELAMEEADRRGISY